MEPCEEKTRIVLVSAVGLAGKDVYVAHERGNWGPECEGSDHKDHPLQRAVNTLWCVASFLEVGEEFKMVVPVADVTEARKIFNLRIQMNAHVGTRFDFDENENTLWLLAHNFPVVRPGEWNQNNVNLVHDFHG